MDQEIQIEERSAKNKGEANRLRLAKRIPVCIYSKGKAADSASVGQEEFATILRSLQPGFLPTTVFALKMQKAKRVVRSLKTFSISQRHMKFCT